jgi:NitT/TauT family transport system permease protein
MSDLGSTIARRFARVIARALPAAVLLVLLGLVWQLVALHNGYLIPRIGAIWQQLDNHPREFLDASAVTLEEAAVGLGVSFCVAFALAVGMSHVSLIERAVMPLAVVLNVTPVVALAPALVVALGFGFLPRYLLTGLIVFFPLLINSLVGLRSIDLEARDYLRSLNASRREVLWYLRIPSSMPYLFAAARICFPLAIVGAVVAEFYAGGGVASGLGTLIGEANQLSELPPMYAAVACLSLLGLALTLVVIGIERRVLTWHPSRATNR